MDAKKFLSEAKRMCRYYEEDKRECKDCPAYDYRCSSFPKYMETELADVVEKWAKEHPIMTNRRKFREVFGADVIVEDENLMKWLNEEYKEPNETIS